MTDQNTSEDIGKKPVLNIGEAASYLGVSRRFIELEIGRGHLTIVRLSARCLRVRREALERYLEARTATV